MTDAIEITLVRHAESESNVTGHWQGQGDSPLSDDGRGQARALARRLAGAHFDRVICSDLSRTCDTAAALGLPMEKSTAWREVDVGRWEGLTRAEVAERFPEEVKQLMAGALDVRIGGAESWLDLYERADAALEELRSKMSPGERALVITHGGVIHGLLSGLLGLREMRPRPIGRVSNTGVSTVRLHRDTAELVRFNDIGHLGPVSHWADERARHGDTVITLVSHDARADRASAPPPPVEEAAGGRLRGAPGMLDIERLGSWYGSLDHLYAGPEAHLRNAAAVLGLRREVGVSDHPVRGEALGEALESLVEKHEGARVGVVTAAAQVAGFVHRTLGGGARVAAPHHATVAHVVATRQGRTIADYNVKAP